MNNAQVIDHEAQMLIKFRSEGKQLAHLCADWDFMAIHAETDEILACCCDFELESDKILRDEIVEKKSTSSDFSSVGAPAHSGTELDNEVAICCMIVSNPGGNMQVQGWQKRVNDLLRGMRDRIKELEK